MSVPQTGAHAVSRSRCRALTALACTVADPMRVDDPEDTGAPLFFCGFGSLIACSAPTAIKGAPKEVFADVVKEAEVQKEVVPSHSSVGLTSDKGPKVQ